MEKEILTCVVPCFNEEAVLRLFYAEVSRVADLMKDQVEFEIVMVDDGSRDNTLEIMRELRSKDKRVKIISFSRNFGKEAAIYAGLTHSHGNYVAVIDADLQHPPAMLIEMYSAIKNEGFDSACAKRTTRKGEPKLRSICAKEFYSVLGKLSRIEVVNGEVDYRLMSRKMVDSVLALSERNRFTKGIFSWVGYKTKWLPYENVERAAGTSKWSFFKLLRYSLEGVFGFSTSLLSFSNFLGGLFCIVAFLLFLVIIIKGFACNAGFSTAGLLACLIMFIGGLQFICIGILGEYLARSYTEIKDRPVYIAKYCETDDPQMDKILNM